MVIKRKWIYIGGGGVLLVVIIGTFLLVRPKPHRFDLSDFDSPDSSGSGKKMDSDFLNMLWKVQQATQLPLKINSGFRTGRHNRKVGGVANSAHTKGMAADIAVTDDTMRRRVVQEAKKAGFKRIGLGRTFVHLDSDPDKRQYVAWGYPSGTKPPFNPFA